MIAIAKNATLNQEPSDLAVGLAGEHVVCSQLLLAGHRAFISAQICAFDVAVEIARGCRLIRVQVKTTRGLMQPAPSRKRYDPTPVYLWHTRRSGKGNRRFYARDAFDVLALVALDRWCVAFLSPSEQAQTKIVSAPKAEAFFAEHTFEAACLALDLDGGA